MNSLLQSWHDPALRLGLRMIKGMRETTARRIEAARAEHPFRDAQDLAERAGLDRHDLAVLAEAAALRGLAGHRHRARWEIAAVEKPVDDLLRGGAITDTCRTDFSREGFSRENNSRLKSVLQSWHDPSAPEEMVAIRPPTEADDIHADYASTGLTLGRHPVALLRPVLRRRRALTARELHALPHGSRARACGLITMRQRPMTASGTVFLTLEDETGCVNVVIWARLFDKQRAAIIGAQLLAIDGVLETDGAVHHLIAERVHDFSELAQGLTSRSRDFC
jgi:error-prone DNA polymerase